MAEVHVTDRDGNVSAVDAPGGRPLMEVLRDANLGVEGICGGACSCGTCHVYVDPQWAERLPPASEDEQMMLDAIKEFVDVRPTSRLSCQITVDDSLAGMTVEIAPEV